MSKSYKLFILIFLFITQLIACAPVAVVGVVGGPVSYADRRQSEVLYFDQKIEFKAILETQAISESSNLSFLSYNQTVLITGEVPSEDVKNKIEIAVKKIDGVKAIKNYLLVGEQSTLKSKGLDVVATSNVKSRLFLNETKTAKSNSTVSPLHIKVYTERQEVYLLGIVTQEEADLAISIAKSSKGVNKVIPLFEINEDLKK